jgi:Putative prokaryotic signal transducing protein
MSEQPKYKSVEVFAGNIIEAGMVVHILSTHNIEAELRDELLGMLAPWVASPGGAGAVKVLVSADDAQAATMIINNISFKDPQ